MAKARIFISYSSKDAGRAAQVHAALEGAGYAVWRDKTRIETDWSREIALALAECDAVCLMWSEGAAGSKWVRHEWLTGRALRKPILVFALPGAPGLPEPISTLQKKESEAALLEYLSVVTLGAQRYDYTFLPARSYLPFLPNPEFAGRSGDLVELYLAMIGNLKKVGLNQAGLHGMGGIGKTQLAVEFAYRFSHAFESVHWIDGTDAGRLSRQFVDLARHRLQLGTAGSESDVDYLHRLQDYLRANGTTLIIIDNLEDPRILNSSTVFPDPAISILTLGANLLFTTRRVFRLPGVVSQNVNVLAEEDAYALLTSYRNAASQGEREAARGIVSATGRLPLALVLIGGYLRRFPAVNFAEYRKLLGAQKLEAIDTGAVSDEELATRHQAAIGATLGSQWRALESKSARLLLRLAACLPESAIVPKARLGLLAGIAESEGIKRPLDSAFLELEDLNLAERLGSEGRSVRLHPLIREFGNRVGTAAERRKLRSAAAARVKRAYLDPEALRIHWIARGPEEVTGDLEAADMVGGNSALTPLRRALGREAGALNLVQEDAQRFVQQLQCRARLMGLKAEAAIMSRSAGGFASPWLRTVAAHPLEDPALLHWRLSHSNQIHGAAFLDERRVATTAWDAQLKIWDAESGELLNQLRGHSKVINTLDVSGDGWLAATGSDDRDVIVWDLREMQKRQTLRGHEDYVKHVQLSADGRYLMSYSLDGVLILWDLSAGTQVFVRPTWNSSVAALNPSGDGILLGYEDGRVEFLDRAGTVAAAFGGGREARCAEFLTNDLAATGGYDGRVQFWTIQGPAAGEPVQLGGAVTTLRRSPWGKSFWAGRGRDVVECELETGKTMRSLRGHVEDVAGVAVSSDGRLAVSYAGFLPRLAAWDLTTKGGRDPRSTAHSESVTALSFSLEGGQCASAGRDRQILVWDRRSAQIRERVPIARIVTSSLCWDRRLLLAKESQQAQLWDLATGTRLWSIGEQRNDLHALALSPDGTLAAIAFGRGDCWIVNVADGTRAFKLSFGGYVHYLCFSEDSRLLLLGSDYGELILWDVESNRELTRHSKSASVASQCLSSCGRYAATFDWDAKEGGERGLEVWDLETGASVARLLLTERVTAMAMSNGHLAIGDRWGRVTFLDLESGPMGRIKRGRRRE